MVKLSGKLRSFFFPPNQSPVWIKLLPYALLGGLTLGVLIAATYVWDYTNSPTFCGQTCHTMPPQYTAYLVSPHARVDCVDCHIGKGFIATRITRKAGDIRHVTATLFKNYEFPIRAAALRPARETCEKCHNPDKFSDDKLKAIPRFADDQANSLNTIYLVMRTGGGSQRQGLGKGIHWHIENKLYYLPVDSEEQTIPYVKVVENDGSIHEYIDISANLDPTTIDPIKLKEMDCITCHNRITHQVLTPEDTVDGLISRGLISSQIPEIHKKAIEVYSQRLETTQAGLNLIDSLGSYYSTYYPDFFAKNQVLVVEAIQSLKTAYANSVYPEQKSDWTSHPNNIGHKDTAGCFRCHDGKHFDAQQEAIRLECNLCHAVPVVAGPYSFIAQIEVSRGPEPNTHKNSNWIAMHNQAFNPTCSNCHTTKNPGGIDNSSFCSNSVCHGTVWKYAGFDAPALRETIKAQLPPQPTPVPLQTSGPLTYTDAIGALLQARCGSCHGMDGMAGLNLTTYQTAMSGSDNGPVIQAGDPQTSKLIQKQSGSEPHFGQLSPAELELVISWIKAGAPEK